MSFLRDNAEETETAMLEDQRRADKVRMAINDLNEAITSAAKLGLHIEINIKQLHYVANHLCVPILTVTIRKSL